MTNALVVADRISEWRRLKALVLDSVSSPITRRVCNLGLDECLEVALIAQSVSSTEPGGGQMIDLARALLNSPYTDNVP
jgi:hypothetical protein